MSKENLKKVIEENLSHKEEIRQRVLENCRGDNMSRQGFRFKKKVFIPIAACMVFILALNISSVFAETMAKVPVIGNVARVLTINEYTKESDSSKLHVVIPEITNTGNSQWEKRTNKLIEDNINQLAEDTRKGAAEYKKEFLAMGNTEKDFSKIIVNFTYEVKHSDENIVSFVVTKDEKGAAPFTTRYVYNYNIKTGKAISLEDMIGKNYKEIVNKQVEAQIKKMSKSNPNLWSYYKEYYATKGAKGIEDNQEFYINKSGNVVVIFDKYVIAPEDMGLMEFEIVK